MNRARISELLTFDPLSGALTWRVTRTNVKAGTVARNVSTHGYLTVRIDGRRYPVHRVAWLLFYGTAPVGQIDHINGNRRDNRIANLRLAGPRDNAANSRIRRDNSTGFKGVSRRGCRFIASIQSNGIQHHLGTFDTAMEASAAYLHKAAALFGEFASDGRT
jgi:hypothetical protein